MNHCLLSVVLAVALAANTPLMAQDIDSVHMANGIKIGEVSSNSAIIWTRLTDRPERNNNGKPFPKNVNKERKSLKFESLAEMEGSVPGAAGEVRIVYWPASHTGKKKLTEWHPVTAKKDFTCQVQLTGLSPGVVYSLIAEGRAHRSGDASVTIEGTFRTAPKADSPARISFSVVTGQDYPRRDDKSNGHKIYSVMQQMDLDFFVNTGDIEYYDKPGPYANSVDLARFKWNRIYAMPYQRAFHNMTPAYFIKDDHDTLKNDCWPGQRYGNLTWDQGLALFREQVPMGDKTYRTVRWGKDLQIWLVEGRDFRSANNAPDGPGKTIWGTEQKQWFFDSVRRSDATFRLLISPTPIVGPDRVSKNDNHANKGFSHEGDEIRSFIGQQQNMYVVCGDRHWQYVSVDPKTGVKEFSCGPTTDVHAAGYREKNKSDMHQYLKVKGGFLSVTVDRQNGSPQVIFRHHGVDGSIYNEDAIVSEKKRKQ